MLLETVLLGAHFRCTCSDSAQSRMLLIVIQWLYGPSSDGRCPSCKTPCSFVPESENSDPSSPSQPDRPLIFLLMEPSKVPPNLTSILPSSSSANPSSGPPTVTEMSRFHWPKLQLSTSSIVLLSRMIGRVLSVVGLTLVLFVLLSHR
jgi:hypothetical protein